MATVHPSEQFVNVLQRLDLNEAGSSESGLLFTNGTKIERLLPTEIFGIEIARSYKADAVYFRRFEDGRSPKPQIYLYDNTSKKFDENEYAQIQKSIWSGCVVPLFLIIEKSKVLIFDSRKPVDIFFDQITADPIETLSTSSQALKEYSAKLFDNGTFWDKENAADKFLESTSAFNDLIDGLKKIRRNFLSTSKLPTRTAHKLLVLSILIKYLEERGDDGETLFAKNFFRQFGADDFCGVLRTPGAVVNLFARLSEHFNGRIFTWDIQEEVDAIRSCDLTSLANFLDANTQGNQYVLWRRYSFNHLPVELISSVYEEFLGVDKSDVVYTPHFLVNTLIDECMPIQEPKEAFSLIDVSCGSGIFLVAGFKRLIEWWRYKKYLDTGNLPPNPDLKTLKSILTSSVFGIDIEEDATSLTIFSLALALCDVLSPKQIWTELKFDDLSRENIVTNDFFKQLAINKKSYDLVIGNPPFKELNRNEFEALSTDNQLTLPCKIPQNQIALLFLEQSMTLLKEQGLLCLIMPSGPLLYNDTLDFRKSFFARFAVSQIFDFTNLSTVLFGANVATSAIFVCKETPKIDDTISHVTIRRTKASKEKIFFEIDHYDFHSVTYEEALTDRYIWKANLFGGVRIAQLIRRLLQLRNLGAFLKQKKETDNWDYGQGYIVGEKNRNHEAPYITGHPTVIDKYFTEDGIKKTEIQQERRFKDKSKESIFHSPHLLIKKSIGSNHIPVAFSNKYLTFRNEIFGIAARVGQENQLKELKQFFLDHSQLLRFLISTTSARSGISRSTFTLLQQDITNLPYPLDINDLKLSYAEKILVNDVLSYLLEQISRGEKAAVNEPVQKKNLVQFSTVFCKALNSVYESENKKFKLYSINEFDTFTALLFHYTTHQIDDIKINTSKQAETAIAELVQKRTGKNLRINRTVKIYERDRIFLIKPKELRYWLKSIALRDADETLDDLIKSGY